MSEFTIATNTKDVLGEVPVWDTESGHLWWTDVFRPAIHRLEASTGEVENWTPPDKVHSFALREAGGLVIAGRKGFALWNPETGDHEPLHDPRDDPEGTLLNDGRADRQGRFWAGTMDKMLEHPSGALYRLDANGNSHLSADGITLSLPKTEATLTGIVHRIGGETTQRGDDLVGGHGCDCL